MASYNICWQGPVPSDSRQGSVHILDTFKKSRDPNYYFILSLEANIPDLDQTAPPAAYFRGELP